MCLFNNKMQEVQPSNTILIGGRCTLKGELVHYLGYYNSIASNKRVAARPEVNVDDLFLEVERRFQSGVSATAMMQDQLLTGKAKVVNDAPAFGFHAKEKSVSGNAMLIMVPAVPGTFSVDNLIPLGRDNTVFTDYARAVTTRPSMTLSITRGSVSKGFEVVRGFDDGLYDLVIASSAAMIPGLLGEITPDKRPVLNEELYPNLDLLYPGWTCLLFCFAEADADRAGGAMITYTSMYPDLIILPGLDGHSGDIETGNVDVDHTLVLGSESKYAYDVAQNDWASGKAFLPKSVIGTKQKRQMPQGDFVFDAREVDRGVFNCLRDLPPGWEKVFGKESVERPSFYFGDN